MAGCEWQGVILVGGKSRRMGRDKALILRGGVPQYLHLAGLVQQVLGRPAWISGRLANQDCGLRRVADREPGAGPLSALLGVYDAEARLNLLVLACDLFAMEVEALRWLLDQASSEKLAVWPRLPGRNFGEPLASLYRQEARRTLEESWFAGNRSLWRCLAPENRFEPEPPMELVRAFRGANTAEDLGEQGDGDLSLA